MRIGIIGGRGWIAGLFKEHLRNKSIQYVDLAHRAESKEIEEEIRRGSLTHILYVAGRTHGTRDGRVYTTIDYLQTDDRLQENVRDNLYSPVRIALWC